MRTFIAASGWRSKRSRETPENISAIDRARCSDPRKKKSDENLLRGVTEWDTKFRCVTRPPAY
jgi:hypothetical protein